MAHFKELIEGRLANKVKKTKEEGRPTIDEKSVAKAIKAFNDDAQKLFYKELKEMSNDFQNDRSSFPEDMEFDQSWLSWDGEEYTWGFELLPFSWYKGTFGVEGSIVFSDGFGLWDNKIWEARKKSGVQEIMVIGSDGKSMLETEYGDVTNFKSATEFVKAVDGMRKSMAKIYPKLLDAIEEILVTSTKDM